MEWLVWCLSRSPIVPFPGGRYAFLQRAHVADLGRTGAAALICLAAARRAHSLSGADSAPLRELVAHAPIC